jgi:hypothetical protein
VVVDVSEIRRERLREHAATVGGPAKLAEKLDKSDSQISQLIGKNPKRNIGRKLARAIELKLQLDPYWLDGTASTAPKSVREELIAEYVRELTPEQQAELLKGLRAAVDANRASRNILGRSLRTIGNERVEEKLGLPDGVSLK